MANPAPSRPLREIIASEIFRLEPKLEECVNGAICAILDAVADAIENPFTKWQQSFSSDLDIIAWLRVEADRAEAGE